jgi:hypothetical protein
MSELAGLRQTAADMAAAYRRSIELSERSAGQIDELTAGIAHNARIRAAVRDVSGELIAELAAYRRRLAVQISAIDRYLKTVNAR